MRDLGTLEFNSLLSQYATTGHTPGTKQTIGLGAFGGAIIATPSPQNSGNTDWYGRVGAYFGIVRQRGDICERRPSAGLVGSSQGDGAWTSARQE
jgi:hypothetical protein